MNPTSIRPTTPTAENGATTAEERCRAKNCGKPRKPGTDHCLGGHWMKANEGRGKSLDRKLQEAEEQTRIVSYRDQYLRDLDWDPERAPLHIKHYCTFLAESLLTVEYERRSKNGARGVAALLPKVQRLYALFETFRRKPQDNEWGEQSLDEMVAMLGEMRARTDTLLRQALTLRDDERRAEIERLEADQSAVPNDGQTAHLAPLPTRTNSESPDNGSSSTVPQVAGRQISDRRDLDPSPVSVASSPVASGRKPDPDEEPRLFVYGRRVTERDVRVALKDTGDLEAYEAGQIPKRRAYELAASWLRNSMEFNPS